MSNTALEPPNLIYVAPPDEPTANVTPIKPPQAEPRSETFIESRAHEPPPSRRGDFVTRQEHAEEFARRLIYAWAEYGISTASFVEPGKMPTGILAKVAEAVAWAASEKIHGAANVLEEGFTDAPPDIRAAFIECTEGMFPATPEHCKPLVKMLRAFHTERRRCEIADKLRQAIETGDEFDGHIAELVALETEATGKSDSMIISGVLSYPTEIPQESILLGNGLLRLTDIGTFISTAGAGKSVGSIQGAICWALGLPYFGIRPARPLRILLFSGEDDGVTMGQCREGLIEHSEAITGRKLTAEDLQPLDSMLRTEFSREHVGPRFRTHLARLLREQPTDLVIINPLLSYIGGEIVACASEWLRAGLMPVLQQFDCAALIAHHTPKLSKDGWENTDDTYSAIGGGEMANIPRTILTLRPAGADGLFVVKVSKRQTTGWKDAAGNFTTSYFVRRTNDPTRPAWLPVDSDEAQDLLAASKGSSGTAKGNRKVTVEHVTDALATGDMRRQALIDWLQRECICTDRPARNAIGEAMNQGLVRTYTEANPKGGHPLRWYALNREEIQ